MPIKILNSLILMLCVFCACFSQKNEARSYPNLELKVLHEWEQLINETSIKYSSVDVESKELDRAIFREDKNTFVLHYKIATVECTITTFEGTDEAKHEFKGYTLRYNKEGNLIEVDEGVYHFVYHYDEKGKLDSTETQVYALVDYVGGIRFPAAKDIKTWDKVKGKTAWTRLVGRELYSAVYYKRKKTKYSFLVKIAYAYFKDGLLAEVKCFNKKGKVKRQETFTYTFYQ